MKKLYVFVFCIFLFTLSACAEASPIPYSSLTFEPEPNNKFVGSYSLGRIRKGQGWPEYGEWSKLEFTFKSKVVCFGGLDSTQKAVFRASEGYIWAEVKHQGRLCLKLQRKD